MDRVVVGLILMAFAAFGEDLPEARAGSDAGSDDGSEDADARARGAGPR